jgi:hypothetical protein
MLHTRCGGLGIIEDKDGNVEVCKECMGSGIMEGVVELDEEGTISALYLQ